MNFLIVRLGALGDIIHAVPAAAALRAAFPDARIDWVVDAKHRAIVDLVTVVDRTIALERSTLAGWADVARRMRQSDLRRRDRSAGAAEVRRAGARVGRRARARVFDLAPARENRAAVLLGHR